MLHLPPSQNLLNVKGLQRGFSLACLSFTCLILALLSPPVFALGESDTDGKTDQPETVATRNKIADIATYNWNLSETQRPLLNLPDQISPNVDLSLSYPMLKFAFPLIQSLYFSKSADQYLLIVIPPAGARAELVTLLHQRQTNIYVDRAAGFLLLDQHDIKIIRSDEGVEYTFTRFADGEFRCAHVSDGRRTALTLTYADDDQLQRVVDAGGRTIRLNYQSGHFASITQTWGVGSSAMNRTWTISNDKDSEDKDLVRRAHASPSQATSPRVAAPLAANLPRLATPALAAVLPRMLKRVPSNATTPHYTSEMIASDRTLARIFGDAGAVAAANGFEPLALASQYPFYRGDVVTEDGRALRGHLSFAMHLYGSADGTGDSAVYVPAGFTSHSAVPTPTDAAITFYYPRLGNLTNVTLAVFHVANFGIRSEGGRIRIGNIGGPGGSAAPYKHSHIEFYRGNTGLPASSLRESLRIDPVSVFTSKSHLAAKSR